MTYAQFLAVFLGIPLTILGFATWMDIKKGVQLPDFLRNLSPWGILLLHVLVAVLYTTPWDNYLVASGVWYYDPALVTGITIGWVPIEEYIFFILQPLLTGLWLLWLARRIKLDPSPAPDRPGLRRAITMFLGSVWLGSFAVLLSGWKPGTYLTLILVWALPPIMLQLIFGADILWKRIKLVATTILSVTIYLSLGDSFAIGAGTWTINPNQSLELFLFGVLPLEEFLFFLATNVLIVFGSTLALSQESRERSRKFPPAKLIHDLLSERKTNRLERSSQL